MKGIPKQHALDLIDQLHDLILTATDRATFCELDPTDVAEAQELIAKLKITVSTGQVSYNELKELVHKDG